MANLKKKKLISNLALLFVLLLLFSIELAASQPKRKS
ncbi:uncharacterized protein G2W53_011204 [Senna tora]|uniref:Uncharacterized protein n=1 Tax=Senna tora TaxID=362788 RepID=A0A834X0T9_9FABA|nr:uncharacterized protein G2W53_011204 [Senna tora]